jgi:hypothetical protein
MKTASERLMSMDDLTWRRHASPWSVYTRYSIFPLLALAVWSRDWLGWAALAPIALVMVWAWLNPRIFPAPDSLDNWASKAVLGEQRLIAHKRRPVPSGMRQAALLLGIANGLSSLLLGYGLIVLELWPTLAGLALVIVFKSWFLDRMVWLEDTESAADR